MTEMAGMKGNTERGYAQRLYGKATKISMEIRIEA